MRGEESEDVGGSEGKDLLITFCGMHVGVNLRAAEVKGLNKHAKEKSLTTAGVDLIVYSCCKLLGHLGVNNILEMIKELNNSLSTDVDLALMKADGLLNIIC